MLINSDFLLNQIYPVGSLYITTNETNPSNFLGGTWEKITSDAYLKIVSSNAGTLSGTSSDHKIPISSMPSHRHGLKGALTGETKAITNTGNDWAQITQNWSQEGFIGYTGGGQAYYPYYYGIYVFRRTA